MKKAVRAIDLRDYQGDLVRSTGEALRRVRRVLVVLPPGGGKTVIAAFIASRFAAQDKAVFFNCHRAELLFQTSQTFARCGLMHSFVAAGRPINLRALVQVCSVDTLKTRLMLFKPPKVVIWDECHHIGAAGWAAIMEAWPETRHIGLTGTPWRGDGQGLGDFFEEMVLGPTPADLIERGNLSPYLMYAPGYVPPEKGRKPDRKAPKLTGDIINTWRRVAAGMRTVGYAINVKHSMQLAADFTAAGIPSEHLDGNTDDATRKAAIDRFANGEIKVLWNVNLFSEGFDLSAIAGRDVTIDCAILARRTKSLSMYLQQGMRCMRPAPGKTAVIIDPAGNSLLHGYPDDEREWDLDGSETKKKAANDNGIPPYTCPFCFCQVRRPLPEMCPTPGCGKPMAAEYVPPEVAAGELKKVTAEEKRQNRLRLAREQAECKDLGALVALGHKRGHKFPMKWAQHVWGNRKHRPAA